MQGAAEPEPEPEPAALPTPPPVVLAPHNQQQQPHVLCLAPDGARLAKPFGPQSVRHAVLEFLALADTVGARPVLLSAYNCGTTGRGWPPVDVSAQPQQRCADGETSPAASAAAAAAPCDDDDDARVVPLDAADAVPITDWLRESGPLVVGGLTVTQGRAIAARLVGLDLCVLLAAAPSLAQLATDDAADGASGRRAFLEEGETEARRRPFHLQFQAWGRPFSGKAKRQRLEELLRCDKNSSSSSSISGLGLEGRRRLSGNQRSHYYYNYATAAGQGGGGRGGGNADSATDVTRQGQAAAAEEGEEPLLLSLLQVHDPSLRDEHGGAGVLQLCLLVAEHAPEVREKKKTYFFAIPVHTFANNPSLYQDRLGTNKHTRKGFAREKFIHAF